MLDFVLVHEVCPHGITTRGCVEANHETNEQPDLNWRPELET
jgi:hypothetical protein